MITEERLKELIEQGAIIYYISEDYIKEIDFSKIVPNKLYYDGFNYYDKYDFNKDEIKVFCEYEKLYEFETKEEAEWQLEFGNITRTETLTLMDYDTFKLLDIPTEFSNSEGECYRFEIEERIGEKYVCIFELNGICSYRFNKTLTKENYIEACRLAKKLFLGEEVWL